MQIPSVRASRRVALLSTTIAAFGLRRANATNQQPDDYPTVELLTLLPKLQDDLSIRVWRYTFRPGQSEELRFQGRSSLMVGAGVATVPKSVPNADGKSMEMFATGPTLPYLNDEGTPVTRWTSPRWQPPHIERYFGLIADDGKFGTVENDGNEDLVVLVTESYPH